ncbi:MAG: hypothetical protein AW06_002982 [Candidatus Accumulibacter cognatus]|uniref:Uncharacterized protein n=1 Tax=Candidatus Accumulibacter cognatus TaxID=2954383 RepID=A0A080M4F6_9PROT|nr:MAG: hypothetical protein AW06_002982 [Candidatus Accumulibacter cognatus]
MNRVSPLGTSACTSICTWPPAAFLAAVLAWMKPVFMISVCAWTWMSPPLPATPLTEVLICALSSRIVPWPPVMSIEPPLPWLALVVMPLLSRASRWLKSTCTWLAATLPVDAAVISASFRRIVGALTARRPGVTPKGLPKEASF